MNSTKFKTGKILLISVITLTSLRANGMDGGADSGQQPVTAYSALLDMKGGSKGLDYLQGVLDSKANPNAVDQRPDKKGNTPLMIAANKVPQAVLPLLKARANPNARQQAKPSIHSQGPVCCKYNFTFVFNKFLHIFFEHPVTASSHTG